MDPNAPLGSFHNPIPYPSEATAASAVHPIPMTFPNPGFSTPTPAHTPSWLQDPSAPLGTFSNPYPQEAPVPPVAAPQAPTPAPAPAVPPPPPPPPPPATNPATTQPTPVTPWLAAAADINQMFDEMFSHASPTPSPINTPAIPPTASNTTTLYQEVERQRMLNEIIEEVIIQQTSSRRTSPTPPPPPPPPRPPLPPQPHPQPPSPNPNPNNRYVHFQNEVLRAQAAQAAALRAAERARQNEAEVQGFVDAEEATRLRSLYQNRPQPPIPMSNTSHTYPSRTAPPPPHHHHPPSPTSSTESVIDAFSQQGSHIPASTLRNPGFSRSTPSNETPSGLGGREIDSERERGRGRETEYERWPLCAICEEKPVLIQKAGVGFCNGCFGRACAAEKGRRGRGRGR
ncbi:MAG: hypothetical protein L6R41_007810 [Letrouitia leprolyta]|nr:MAG: hypothetical protein L6R41_007810 [Letrouitia leprolyta]